MEQQDNKGSPREKRLVQAAAQHGGFSEPQCLQLVENMAGFSWLRFGEYTFQSTLNNNNSPLQICVGCKKEKEDIRFIVDPLAYMPLSTNRLNYSKKILASHFTYNSTESSFQKLIWDAILYWTSSEKKTIESMRSGYFWMGTDIAQQVTAIYISTRKYKSYQQWIVLSRWLYTLNIDSFNVVNALRLHANLASVAIEGNSFENGRIKLYWRLGDNFLLDQQPHPWFTRTSIVHFIQFCILNSGVSKNGLLLSISWRLNSRMIDQVKIDLCGHCLSRSENDWNVLFNKLSNRFCFSPPVTKPYFQVGAKVAFVSLASDKNNNDRFNIYWKV